MSLPQPDHGTQARDQAAMAQLQAGQDTALNELMERHATPVFHLLCRLTGNPEDASDLAQETFVRVFKARAGFRLGQPFSAWLHAIAANLARNHYRWRRRHPNVSLDAESPETSQSLGSTLPAATPPPGELALARERAQAVRQAVQELAGDLREAIVLCEWQDLSVAEAASLLRASPKAVESRLYRARQALRKKLQPWL